MLDTLFGLAEDALRAPDALSASGALYDRLVPKGATYLQSRRYRRPGQPLTSASHWAAAGFVARFAPADWPGSAAFNYVCFEQNPLLEPIRRGMTRYRFSDFAPHKTAAFERYWEALGEAHIADALCATAYGADRRIFTFHIGFETADIAENEAFAVQAAAMIVAERLMSEGNSNDAAEPDESLNLSDRERDSMIYVALGKTDWEIGMILGIAQTTAKFHVDNARRKLNAVNRAHAVARYLALTGPF